MKLPKVDEILERVIQEVTERYGMDVEVKLVKNPGEEDWIAIITPDGGEPINILFSREDIDDLPGHVKEVEGRIVPLPTDDTFLRDKIQRPVNDRVAERVGKKIGF